MIAYLDKYDTTVEVPDDISDKDMQDVNENFHHYVDTSPSQPTPTAQPTTSQPEVAPAPETQPKWQPNFYQSVISDLIKPVKVAGELLNPGSPEAQAFAGKAAEGLTFGAAKPLIEPVLSQQFKDHPAFADAGAITGGVGSLMEAGGALRILGLGAGAAAAGTSAVEAGFAAGERFIPRAIMTGATFGTRTFIAETVKHFEEGGVNLEQFGKDVLKDTAFGGMFGSLGGFQSVGLSVSSAGALGFISSKMSGSDNREASLNAAVWAAFETVGSAGKSEALRMEALGHLKDSIGEYIGERNPDISDKDASRAASAFVDHTITKAGFDNAEDIAKSGPENLLEGIEKVNQAVRNARVPATPEAQSPLLPKLPAPIEPEAEANPQATPAPKTPIEKAIDTVKGLMGIKAEEPAEPKPPTVTGDTYDEKVQSLKDQGHDISKMPQEAFPEDMKDVFHFEQGKTQSAAIEKGLGEIAERFQSIGIKPQEGAAIFNAYGLDKKDQFGNPTPAPNMVAGGFGPVAPYAESYVNKAPDEFKQIQEMSDDKDIGVRRDARKILHVLSDRIDDDDKTKRLLDLLKKDTLRPSDPEYTTEKRLESSGPEREVMDRFLEKATGLQKQNGDLLNAPIEEQYVQAYKTIAAQRGIDKGEKFDAETMDQAQKSVDLINGYFSPKSQEIKNFVEQHGEASDHDIAQMAYDRGMIESPNPDLLKAEIQKSKQENPAIHADMAPAQAATAPRSFTPKVVSDISTRVQASKDEISHLVVPANAAPLAAQITREQLGKMARSYDMAEAALSDAKDLFDKQSKEKNLEFIDRMEHGQEQPNENLNGISTSLRKLLDDKRREVQSLGKGKLESFIENYFPHIWDQGEKEVGQAVQKASKRPFEGQKSFLKKRSIEFTKDGVAMGLTPVSYNPVDLALLKIREMDKYIMAHRTIKEFKQEGLAQYIKIGGDVPDGWQKIDDRISTVFKSPMVAVQEAYDAKIMGDLNAVGKNLGVNLERSTHSKAKGLEGETLGYSQSAQPGEPGNVWTRFGGPESTLAHELGHQVDNIYGLQEKFLSDPKINKELTALAHERRQGEISEKDRKYIESPPEKMAVMFEGYIHAPDLFKEKAPTAYAKLEEFLKSDPKLEPLTHIEPSLLKEVNKSEVYAGGAVIAGHIYAQADAARIINNYLSPGLQKSAIYQAYRYAGNLINQFQLGLSAFHLGFTTVDSIVSKTALALNQLAAGNPMKAISNLLETPFSPITTLIKGNDLLKAWRGEGQNQSDDVLAEAMASAGGRARMDQFYATKASEQMRHYFEKGNFVKGVFSIPFSLLNISSKPTLEYIVPRMKLGAFSDIMKMEMENNPNMTHAEMRDLAQKAWDSVDNRLGQMVYDNLFWNRTFKDLLMASVRSVGWNLGTMRELVGGAKDYAESVSDAVQGKKTDFSYRMAYLTALPLVVGALGAMMQYMRTGKGPQEAKDYFFPKTGGVDTHGDPHRIALPSYTKDIYHYSQDPIRTVANKLNPLIAMVAQMFENKDFYGTKIRNEDDPLVKQVAAEAGYMVKQVIPFSIRNMLKNQETGNKSLFDTVGPWVGITPAPYDIDQTKAEKLSHEIAMSHQEIGGRTDEQMERSRLVSDLTRRYKMGDPKATEDLYKAYEAGAISHRQMQEVMINARLTPLQRSVKNMTLEETERVYAKANDEEKAQIESMLERKKMSHARNFVAQP